MNIKIIGSNSSNRMKLIKNLNRALEELDLRKEIELADSNKEVEKYHISNTPALIINEKVISQGKVLTDKEIKKYLKLLA